VIYEEFSLSFAITLDDEKNADRRGKVAGRNRMTAELMPGPNRRNKYPTGLAAVAIEVETCRLRTEALSRGPLSGEMLRRGIRRRPL
jgi:hypothetical protein